MGAYHLLQRIALPSRVLNTVTVLASVGIAAAFQAAPVAAQAFNVDVTFNYAAGTNPYSVAVGDVNGDGRPDLVAANYGSNTVSVFLGNSGGGFGAKTDFATGANPFSVAIGDLNGDGMPDLAVANSALTGTVSVLLGNGAGGFGPKTDYVTGLYPNSVAIGDLNDDGRSDLAVANYYSNTVSVLLADGQGGFTPKADFETGTWASCVAIGEVSGDGRADLLVTNAGSNTVSALLGDGAGGFGAKTDFSTGSSPASVAVGDLNGDGRADLAVACVSSNVVSVLLGDGTGGFGVKTDFAAGTNPYSVAIGDMNGDALPDLAVANNNSHNVSVLLGTGTGGFGAKSDFETGTWAHSVVIGDMNGDGRADLVVANGGSNTVSVLLGNVANGLGARTDFASGRWPSAVVIGDLNGDGRPDLVVTNNNADNVSVFLGDGAGGFGTKSDFATGMNPWSVAIADLNGDRLPDLAVANRGEYTVSVLPGNGAGGFGARVDIATSAHPQALAIGDLNVDGFPDIAVANGANDMVSVLLGNVVGGFGARTDFATGSEPSSVAIADVNGDGWLDLATANYGGNSVSVLLGDGAGGFGAKTNFATGPVNYAVGSISVASGDLNGDGHCDLAVANYLGRTVSVLRGDGLGGFGARTDYILPTLSHPTSVAIGDISADGCPDLAVANAGANTVSVLLGNGLGGCGARTDFATGSYPSSVVIGDISGDGRLDLAVASLNPPYLVSILLGLTPTRVALTATPNPAVLGAPATLTAAVSIPAPGHGAPTGSVQFFDGSTLLGTSSVNNGVASLGLFSPRLGDRAITAVYKGDGKLFGSFSSVRTLRVVASAKPAIARISDVKGDQGKQVFVRFMASPFDHPASGTPVTSYLVYRKLPVGSVAHAQAPATVGPSTAREGQATPLNAMLAGWVDVATVTATTDAEYNVVVPTLADSNASGAQRAILMVRALTATPAIHFDSAPDSGCSVDNLPPMPPAPFTAAYVGGATHLHWGASVEADFWYYRIYRGASSGFTPGPGNLIATASDTGHVDVGPLGGYYKLSAIDVNGNESGFAVVTPAGTLEVADDGALAFALAGVRPNPSRGGALVVAFSLPTSGEARLLLLDVSGRQVAIREVGSLGAGRHTVDLVAGRRLPPGIYLVRLTQGASERVKRVVVVE